ncbi:hypothetical protein [Janibacter sp. G368]|uniref:hypothetical protein n=1 Tax=Janibacter sp. G368 TaxID=3420441 RepID=UPI003D01CB7A
MHLQLADDADGLRLELDDDARRFLRANIIEAMQELGEDEYDTRTGFTLEEARQVADLLRPVVPGTASPS